MKRKKQQQQVLTRWGERFDPKAPLQEYPRPQLWRKSFRLLNGVWEFTLQKEGELRPRHYEDAIVVPFPPESALSCVKRPPCKGERLWYRRPLELPPDFLKDKLFCHFGAVDQMCTVYLNGYRVGTHRGGYLPFTMDLTPFLHSKKENVLEVEVWDETERGCCAYGQQSRKPGQGRYPAYSGLWQTVWLESLPMTYIKGLRITPLYDDAAVRIELAGGPIPGAHVDVLAQGTRVAAGTFDEMGVCRVTLEEFESWTPERPFLYDLRVYAGTDEVESYFAMRKFSAVEDEKGRMRFGLNNRPYFCAGILDDGYWPDGLSAPPDDQAIRSDLEDIKAMGFNMVRKHQKVESMRWYYHCDRLGLLVFQDMPRGGRRARAERKKPACGRCDKPSRYFGRTDAQARTCFEEELAGLAAQLYNIPSIAVYTVFEEGKGQFDALRLTETLWLEDPTRLVDHAAGWCDQGGGDFKSVRALKNAIRPRTDGRIWMVSSFGGIGLGAGTAASGRPSRNEGELRARLKTAYQKMGAAAAAGLSGCVYLRLADLPGGSDGLLTADRRTQKLAPDELAALNRMLLAAAGGKRL